MVIEMEKKYKHIGIVAVSSPGATLCYQTICTEGEKLLGEKYAHPEVSMHGYPFNEYMKRIERGDWSRVAELLISSAKKLASIGADFVICPDNTIHIVFDEVIKKSPIPWLHIAEEVAKEAMRRKFKKLAILGTKFLMESKVYPSRLETYGIEWTIPNPKEREIINRIIFEELVYGIIRDSSKNTLVEIIDRLAREENCDAVVLGCTELPLIINDSVSPIPTLDSTRILARAALRKAVGLE